MTDDPKKPDSKLNPVVEAVAIALFSALATKAVDKFFAWLEKREKEAAAKAKKKAQVK